MARVQNPGPSDASCQFLHIVLRLHADIHIGRRPWDNWNLASLHIDNQSRINKPKFIGAQLSVNVVALAVIDTDADVDADVATDSTIAAFATFDTFDTVATLASFASFADGDPDVGSHLH